MIHAANSQSYRSLTNPSSARAASWSNWDARKYPLCPPFDGEKGLLFKQFKDEFLTAIATIDLRDPNEVNQLDETLMVLKDY